LTQKAVEKLLQNHHCQRMIVTSWLVVEGDATNLTKLLHV